MASLKEQYPEIAIHEVEWHTEEGQRAKEAFSMEKHPETFFLSAEGKLLTTVKGFRPYEQLESLLQNTYSSYIK